MTGTAAQDDIFSTAVDMQVGAERLELSRVSPYASETYAYTNSATRPCEALYADYSALLLLRFRDVDTVVRGGEYSLRLFDRFDIRTESFQALVQALVAPINRIHIAKCRLTFCGKHADKK